MNTLPKIALGAWAWGNDGTFGGRLDAGISESEIQNWISSMN